MKDSGNNDFYKRIYENIPTKMVSSKKLVNF